MLITTSCPSCAAKLTLSSYAEGKRISCVQCGHKFILPETAAPAPVVLQPAEPDRGAMAPIPHPAPVVLQAEPADKDWQDQPPVIRQQRPAPHPYPPPPVGGGQGGGDGEDTIEQTGRESVVSETDELDQPNSDESEWKIPAHRPYNRGRVRLATYGVLFGMASLVCLLIGLSAKFSGIAAPIFWLCGAVASAYIGVHLSLFGTGLVRIVGVLLNIVIMLACVVWAVIRIRGG